VVRECVVLQPSGYCRETSEPGRSHAASFDHRRRPDTLRSAMATAFFCATKTTSCLPPRVLAVRLIIDYAARTTERTRRPGCRSRDHQIARSHRSAGLAGTAISSPPQRLLGTALSIVKTPSSTTLRSFGQGIVGSFVKIAGRCKLRPAASRRRPHPSPTGDAQFDQ
jgi:hypothetical protein